MLFGVPATGVRRTSDLINVSSRRGFSSGPPRSDHQLAAVAALEGHREARNESAHRTEFPRKSVSIATLNTIAPGQLGVV